MAKNPGANFATGLGMTACGAALFCPATAPIAAVGLVLLPIARGIRAALDKHEEKKEVRQRRREMNSLPTRYGLDYDPFPVRYPHYDPFIVSQSPESIIAEYNPSLGAGVLKKQSADNVLTSLMNSSVATEFARQGRGVRAGVRIRKSWFSGAETTEAFIKPID